MLVPMVMVDSLGLRRLGSVMGVSGIFATIGGALGPIIAGKIFDLTGSYVTALEMFVVMSFVAGAAVYSCLPLSVEQSRLSVTRAAA